MKLYTWANIPRVRIREIEKKIRRPGHLNASFREQLHQLLVQEWNWRLKYKCTEKISFRRSFVSSLENYKNWLIGLILESLGTYLSKILAPLDLGKTWNTDWCLFFIMCDRILASWVVKVLSHFLPSNEKYVNNGIFSEWCGPTQQWRRSSSKFTARVRWISKL